MEKCPFRLATSPNPDHPKSALCTGDCAWFINLYGCAILVLAHDKLGTLKPFKPK
jgi:hypothetical protein